METLSEQSQALSAASKTLMQRLFLICENRLQLFLVEAQEEGQRILLAVILITAASIFGVLAGVALTAVIAVLLWNYSPVIALLTLTALYLAIAVFLGIRLKRLIQNWRTLAATLDQLRKDRDCLKRDFS